MASSLTSSSFQLSVNLTPSKLTSKDIVAAELEGVKEEFKGFDGWLDYNTSS